MAKTNTYSTAIAYTMMPMYQQLASTMRMIIAEKYQFSADENRRDRQLAGDHQLEQTSSVPPFRNLHSLLGVAMEAESCVHSVTIMARSELGPKLPKWMSTIYPHRRPTTIPRCQLGEPPDCVRRRQPLANIKTRFPGHACTMLPFDARDMVLDYVQPNYNLRNLLDQLRSVYDDPNEYKMFTPDSRRALIQLESHLPMAMLFDG